MFKSTKFWRTYVGRGAPSNTVSGDPGIGRTEEQARHRARHFANQQPFIGAAEVSVFDNGNSVPDNFNENLLWCIAMEYTSMATWHPALAMTEEQKAAVDAVNKGLWATAAEHILNVADAEHGA